MFFKNVCSSAVIYLKSFFYPPSVTDLYAWRHGETNSNHYGLLSGGGANKEIAHLNWKGYEQAAQLAQKVFAHCPKMQLIYSSDLQRALETAKSVQKAFLVNRQIEIIPATQLREIYHGEHELTPASRRNDQAERLREKAMQAPIEDRLYFWKIHPVTLRKVENDASIRNVFQEASSNFKEPETVYELYRRVHAELTQIAKDNRGKQIGISTHGGVLATLIDGLNYLDKTVFLPPFYMTKKYEKNGKLLMPAATKIDNCALIHFRYHHDTDRLEYCGQIV